MSFCWIFFKISKQEIIFVTCTFYSILNNLVSFPHDCVFPSAIPYSRSHHYNPNAYRLPLAHCNGLSFSYFYILVSVWNNLPTQAVTATTLPVFKIVFHPYFSGRKLIYLHLYIYAFFIVLSWARFILALAICVSLHTCRN